MRSSMLLCALALLVACEGKDASDDSSSGTDDSGQVDDSAGVDDSSTSVIDADKDGYDSTEDCDDTDAAVNPGATEMCDGIDNNCVAGIDEGVTSPFYADSDGDTYGAGDAVQRCAAPKGYVDNADDCDDTTAAANPGATEVCDEIDNNCVDGIDEGLTTPFYADSDGDTYGAGTAMDACAAPTGYVGNADDCDDADADAHPGASEVCDAADNDCDSDIDDDDSDLVGGTTYWQDYDSDGYGDPKVYTSACDMPSGYVDNDDDCYDGDANYTIYEYKYYDGDYDGYGDWEGWTCENSAVWVYVAGDCDGSSSAIYPGATEVCDGDDNDCDAFVDADDADIVYTTWFADTDEDGYGDKSTATDTCDPPSGYVTTSGDCDDTQWLVSPSRNEYCDGIDNNCDGATDETADYVDWYRDDDGDHYGQDGDVLNDCAPPRGYDLYAGDCDDDNTAVNPGHEEVCADDLDNECDGYVDNCSYDVDDAFFSLSGNMGGSQVGYSVASGDVDGDGTDDLLVGTPQGGTSYMGAIYVVNGGTSGNITVADVDATIDGSSWEYMGYSTAAGDVDGDGYDDVLTGAAWNSKAYMFMGPISSTTAAYADLSLASVDSGTSFGNAVAIADLDADGNAESAVAEPYEYSGYGQVSIFRGPPSGARPISS